MIPIKRRRILTKIKINEISGVDTPAQEGAIVTIMKRREQELPMSLNALEDRVLVLKDRADVLTKTLADRPEPAAPTPDFDEVVAAIEKRDQCSGTLAFTKARKEHPDAFATYNRLQPKKPAKQTDDEDFEDLVAAAARKSAPAADFMREVDNVMIAKNLSRTQAMSEARRQNPELFAKFQEV